MSAHHRYNPSLLRALIEIRSVFATLIYTPDNAELLRSYDNNHHAGGVMDHLAALIDSLAPEPGDREPFFPPSQEAR